MAKTQTTEANAAAFTKVQLVASQRYVHRRDLIGALLEDGKTYTLNEVDAHRGGGCLCCQFHHHPGPGHREPGGDGERPGGAQHQRHQPL